MAYIDEYERINKEIRRLQGCEQGSIVKRQLNKLFKRQFFIQKTMFSQPIAYFKSKTGSSHRQIYLRQQHRTGYLRSKGYTLTKKDSLKPKINVFTGR